MSRMLADVTRTQNSACRTSSLWFVREVQGAKEQKQICSPKRICGLFLNLLKPTGYVMRQQFNIQQLYALPTLYLCVLYLSENKQRLMPPTA